MAFATTADLGRYLGRTLSEDEEFRAQRLLDLATGAIRGYCRQHIDFVASDSAVLRGNWTSELILPERPVTAVTSVTVSTTSLTVDQGYTWDGSQTLFRGAREYLSGELGENPIEPMRHELHWGGPSAKVTVVYSHGLTLDDPLMLVPTGICLEMAARALHTTPGVKQESIGQYSYTADSPGQSSATTLTVDMRKQLRDAGFRRW